MSGIGRILFQAQVAVSERRAVKVGVEQLVASLGAVTGGKAWPARIVFTPQAESLAPVPGVSAILVSLMPDVERLDEPIEITETRWRTLLPTYLVSDAPVFLWTVFRHVRERARDGGVAPVLERIRRLNRMAADLSHDYGIGVIDIDRAFAHIGGRALKTDWQIRGVMAEEAAGHTMAWSLLSFGLDNVIDPLIQEKARDALGNLGQIDKLLQQRLARRRVA